MGLRINSMADPWRRGMGSGDRDLKLRTGPRKGVELKTFSACLLAFGCHYIKIVKIINKRINEAKFISIFSSFTSRCNQNNFGHFIVFEILWVPGIGPPLLHIWPSSEFVNLNFQTCTPSSHQISVAETACPSPPLHLWIRALESFRENYEQSITLNGCY